MESSSVKSLPQVSNNFLNSKSIGLVAAGIILVIGGIFVLLAVKEVLPRGVNAISSWGIGGYAAGIIPIVVGTILIGIASQRTKPHPFAINEEKFKDFFAYHSKTPDRASSHATNTAFFYANCDEVECLRWGCAWRSIQICASSLNLYPSFNDLFYRYRQTFEKQEWAEPGYGKRYLDDMNIPSQLLLYKKENGTSKTPTEKCKKIATFSELKNYMVEHFRTYKTPIMADDVSYACAIIGIRITEKDETILFIADPHKTDHASGLYYVVLDKEGNKIATTGIDNDLNGLNTTRCMFFTKGWMFLCPQPTNFSHPCNA